METTRKWFDDSYSAPGLHAQRFYPNEELCRFMGRNFFGLPREARKSIAILEAGCGSCANLWMLAKEGFSAYGIDLSPASIELGRQMLAHWDVQAELRVGSMTDLPYEAERFDDVCDVFSSYCLSVTELGRFVSEAHRVLKPGGRLFMYAPSVGSDAFIDFAPATKLDEFTLSGIHRKDAPFTGSAYPFRFVEAGWLRALVREHGFEVQRCESIRRTYNDMAETFEHLSVEIVKR